MNGVSKLSSGSKRPPKLRSACNECHAAKVRCSGEKTGCQRCYNLHLKCVFSISRIGKVPGKRSKANRAAASASTSASSSSLSSTLTSVSSSSASSSISTPIVSPPQLTQPHSFESSQERKEQTEMPPSVTFTDSMPITPITPDNYANTFFYHGHNYSLSVPQYKYTEEFPDPSNLTWTTNIDFNVPVDHFPRPGLPSPAWQIGPPPLPSTEPDPDPNPYFYNPTPPPPPTQTETQTPPDFVYPPPSPAQYTLYLHLLHSIDQTLQLEHHPNALLAASQRYLTTLLQLSDTPTFTTTYTDNHLLFSVALARIVHLHETVYPYCLPQAEETHNSEADRWEQTRSGGLMFDVEFGFGFDHVEKKEVYKGWFAREVKRARVCLGRLMRGLLLRGSEGGMGIGRHEGLCEEMRGRLEGLID